MRAVLKKLYKQRVLVLISIPFIIHVIIFSYLPMAGSLMAFQDYDVTKGIPGSPWVGFQNFIELFQESMFLEVIRNTLVMSLLRLVFMTVGPIFLALLLNETHNKLVKKSVQTATTLPHFLSWPIAAGMVIGALSPSTGIINKFLLWAGMIDEPVMFMARGELFWWINTFSMLWKEIGWSSIIYLAAMTGIDRQIYEAASIDGAGRLQKIWHITLPGIQNTVILLLIVSIGYLMNSGYEQQMVLRNSFNTSYSRVFELFELQFGFGEGRFSYGTAASLFRSVISLTLIMITNFVARKMDKAHLI